MRKLALLAAACGFILVTSFASAQQLDVGLGFGTVTSSGSSACTVTACSVAEKGGTYPAIGFDVIFHKRIGFGFETAWKASQGAYGGPGGQPFRPILYDFNAVYQPRFSKTVGADLMAGIGAQSTRFYLPYCTNGFTCNNYSSDNHFLVHLGGGLRYYFWHHVFVRPEVHYYKINNNVEFSSDNVIRVGGTLGFTLGPE